MPLTPPYPELEELIVMIGEAGVRLSEIEATEGAAGNLSLCIGWQVEPPRRFPQVETIDLPLDVPELSGRMIIATGSGRRLREIRDSAQANLGILVINPGGQTAKLYTSPSRLFARLTGELNSHLAIHRDQVNRTGTNLSAVVHAQPLHLTYLSHIPRYQDTDKLTRALLRWEPEMIVNLSEGVCHLPFMLPSSAELMQATTEALRKHKVVVWGKHGVVARSDYSIKKACDLVEYAETGARYECLNLANNEQAEGLTPEQIRTIAAAFGVEQHIF